MKYLFEEFNDMLTEADGLEEITYELADAMDVSFGEAGTFIDDLAYVLAYTLKTSKGNMVQAIVKSFTSKPDIVDSIAGVGDERKAIAKLRSNIKDQRSWGQLLGGLKKWNMFPPEVIAAVDQMRKAVY